MKTDELISALVADTRPPPPLWARNVGVAASIGALASAIVFLSILGFRPNLIDALSSWRFDLKLALIGLAVILALRDAASLTNPTNRHFATWTSWLLPVAIASAVALELWLTQQDQWGKHLFGTNWLVCMVAIPVLSLAPLAAGIYAMRSGAPASSAVAGAALGRLAAALGALVYAMHCIDDSPLFVAAWYSIATLTVIAIGAVAGRMSLRW